MFADFSDTAWRVSIRSPHRSKGRHMIMYLILRTRVFQSAPLTEARGDKARMNVRRMVACFNPLPSPKQGETSIFVCIRAGVNKFQSAPLTEARGDQARNSNSSRIPLFQSAPLTEARGDSAMRERAACYLCFNPLPSPKQGETSSVLMFAESVGCFNPLPSPKQGETLECKKWPHPR